MARKRPSVAKAETLKPGKSLYLSTTLDVKPSRAASRALDPGTYTVEVSDGGYTAETTLRIAAP